MYVLQVCLGTEELSFNQTAQLIDTSPFFVDPSQEMHAHSNDF